MSEARIRLVSHRLSAIVDSLGAELLSLCDADGRELMTDADPAFWAGHAPLLFPIVGRLNGDVLRCGGTEYPMKQHGFARRSPFEPVEQSTTRAVFRLEDSAETRAVYPFAFVLRVTYEIVDATLSISVAIDNRGDRAIPASFGFHPAFAWPLPYGGARADHRIVFAADEPAPLRALADGLIEPAPRRSPLDGRTLALDDALFAADALIWDRLTSHSVRYGGATGPQLRIDFPGTPCLGIWSKPGARFVCIEPWHGLADPVGFTGDFTTKPGVFEIAPGASWTTAMQVTLEA